MNPEQWRALTPEQQAWHLGRMSGGPAVARPPRDARALSITALVLAVLAVLTSLIGLPSAALLGGVIVLILAIIAVCVDQRGRAIAVVALVVSLLPAVLYFAGR